MKPGSVIVDLAAEKGGNCDLTKPGDKIVTKNNTNYCRLPEFSNGVTSQSSTLWLQQMLDM